MKKVFFIFTLSLLTNVIEAQFFRLKNSIQFENRNWHFKNGWYLNINPFTLVEPISSGIGLGMSYRFKDRYEVSNEINYLIETLTRKKDELPNQLKGVRIVSSFKYYINNNKFLGIENRIKNYTFNDVDNFYNEVTKDSLFNYSHKAQHHIFGFALLYGQRFALSKNGKLQLECTSGIGGRKRNIKRIGVPIGYEYKKFIIPKEPSFYENFEESNFVIYMPFSIKLYYKL